MEKRNQPVSNVQWVHRDLLKANDYNPNKVAPPEMELLEISILSDGWTQPIVVTDTKDYFIVDGFHRYTVSGNKKPHPLFGISVYELTDGHVPIVELAKKDRASLQMATIRHNRARGTHTVLNMSAIVCEMVAQGVSGKEIMERLQMEEEEVTRLLFVAGIPKHQVFDEKDFSNAWVPGID